jgi:hypothetical protein
LFGQSSCAPAHPVILVPCDVLGLLTVDHYDVSSVETCSSAVVHSATEQDALEGSIGVI